VIRRLWVRDFVRVKDLDLELGPGLTVLTGGSGEGKSLVLEALAFGLGEVGGGREAASRLVRRGADTVEVRLEVDTTWGRLRHRLAEAGIPASVLEDERLLLSRSLDRAGRSRLRAGDRTMSLATLRAVGAALVERFRQGQAQRLVDPVAQRELLDGCAGLQGDVSDYASDREQVLELVRRRDALVADEARLREAHAASDDERRALAGLAPEVGEFEALLDEQLQLEAFEAQRRWVVEALLALDDREGSPLERLRAACTRLDRVDGLGGLRLVFADGIGLLDEAAASLEAALGQLGGEPGRLEWVRERRSEYHALARRLGTAPEALAARWADLDGARLEALVRSRQAADASLTRRQAAPRGGRGVGGGGERGPGRPGAARGSL
jgi:DNA repair protein RecN (Recombination protein N)